MLVTSSGCRDNMYPGMLVMSSRCRDNMGPQSTAKLSASDNKTVGDPRLFLQKNLWAVLPEEDFQIPVVPLASL